MTRREYFWRNLAACPGDHVPQAPNACDLGHRPEVPPHIDEHRVAFYPLMDRDDNRAASGLIRPHHPADHLGLDKGLVAEMKKRQFCMPDHRQGRSYRRGHAVPVMFIMRERHRKSLKLTLDLLPLKPCHDNDFSRSCLHKKTRRPPDDRLSVHPYAQLVETKPL